jgi:hypothetical protein
MRLKPKSLHTTLIPRHHILTLLLRILRRGEEHAFITGGFFICAYAAGLFLSISSNPVLFFRGEAFRKKGSGKYRTLTFCAASPVGFSSAPAFWGGWFDAGVVVSLWFDDWDAEGNSFARTRSEEIHGCGWEGMA